jgi:ATP-dependent helicase/nuclease subunit A
MTTFPETVSRTWTHEQQLGIATIGHSLLVSAAAGSGKTAVLAERCAHLVCNAEPPCDVDELLVVTFTRPAAAEMRIRIEGTLRKRLDDSGEEENSRLGRQVALLDRAAIGTLHSICMTILREHFHLIGLDPAFTLIEEDQAKLLRLETARQLFADRYDGEDAAAFSSFVDQYVDGRDETLIQRVISTHDLLCSVVDPDTWRKRALDRIIEASQGTLAKTELGKSLVAEVRDRLADLQARCVAATESFDGEQGLDPYAEHVNDLQATIQWWIDCFGGGSFDRLADAVRNVEIPKLPSIPGSTFGKDAAHETINSIKAQMKPKGALGSLCRFSETEWKHGLAQTIEPTQVFLNLVEEFTARFDAAKQAIRSLDYSDLERRTLQILSNGNQPSAVARLYHARFKHVLVDEYQDINEVQDRILSLVSRESVLRGDAPGGNLFCVGDVKQSIYRFRLAQPLQFMDRAGRFGRGKRRDGGQVIDLRTNFRSRPPLLDCLNGLFERLMTRSTMEIEYDDTHRLRAPESSPYQAAPCDGPPVLLHLLPSPSMGASSAASETGDAIEEDRTQREAGFVANEIRKLIATGTPIVDKEAGELQTLPTSRPIRYGDIAILLRSMKFKADQFAQALRIAGIPVHSDSSTGFFDSMEMRDMLALLAVLDNQQQDIPLAAVLRSPLLGLPHAEDVMASARLAFPDPAVPFHVAIMEYAKESPEPRDGAKTSPTPVLRYSEEPGPSAESRSPDYPGAGVFGSPTDLKSSVRQALQKLSAWRELTNKRPLADAIWTIYTQSNYLAFCSGLTDGEQCVANLLALHERAKQFDGSGQRQGLGRFRLFLDALREESDLGQPSIAVDGENAVRIMSIHRSKGLEFPIVFVPDLGKRHNFQSCAGTILVDRNAYVGLSVVDEEKRIRYPSLAHAMAKESIRRQTLAEELRVFYVAATRACERLILVGTAKSGAAEEWLAEYGNHIGPLSAGVMLGGQTPLDWIGPAASALSKISPELISIITHNESELVAQQNSGRPKASEFQEQLANLLPLNPAPPMTQKGQEILHRLDHSYRFVAFTELPAARSVSQLAAAGHDRSAIKLATPRAVSPEQPLAATEIGDATHIVMEHLDFGRPASVPELQIQVDQLVKKRFLTAAGAGSVDLDGVAWFMSSELGKLMREHAADVCKELPIFFALEDNQSRPTDPLDRTMVRGRIDVLVPLADRCVLIDYKTDRIAADAIDAQVEHHRAQISLYANALKSVLHLPIEGYLAFLTARQWRVVPISSA